MTERSQVVWGTTTIPYAIRRSSRRATVSLAIDPVGGLLVTAPAATPVLRLDAVVKSKARWVVERLRARRPASAPAAPREFVSGETFSYLGRQYRVRLVPGGRTEQVALRGAWLEVPVPARLSQERRRSHVRAALVAWYRTRAAERLPALTAAWADRLGLEAPEVRVTEQAKRWGSCSGKVLRINWRVIQAPRRLVEYVVAHEVVHLVVEHHGRAFWTRLGSAMPDYETQRQHLMTVGPTLVW